MPCDQVRMMTLELEAANHDLLKKALEAIGATVYESTSGLIYGRTKQSYDYSIQNGKINVDERSQNFVNTLKQAYSREVVKAAGQKFGWQVNQKSPRNLRLAKRAI